VDESDRGILQGGEQRADDERSPQPEARHHEQDHRPDQEPQQQGRAAGEKDHRRRQPGAQQVDAEEDAGDAPGELMQTNVERESVDATIGEERHQTVPMNCHCARYSTTATFVKRRHPSA